MHHRIIDEYLSITSLKFCNRAESTTCSCNLAWASAEKFFGPSLFYSDRGQVLEHVHTRHWEQYMSFLSAVPEIPEMRKAGCIASMATAV